VLRDEVLRFLALGRQPAHVGLLEHCVEQH
jgi:hypothetical protein